MTTRNNNESYALQNIAEPNENDILSGRGKQSYNHPGNATFRELITMNKPLYSTLEVTQKNKLSKSIVSAIRSQNPPGRFLTCSRDTGLWNDMGNKKAVEKVSQALREGQQKTKRKLSSIMDETPPNTYYPNQIQPIPNISHPFPIHPTPAQLNHLNSHNFSSGAPNDYVMPAPMVQSQVIDRENSNNFSTVTPEDYAMPASMVNVPVPTPTQVPVRVSYPAHEIIPNNIGAAQFVSNSNAPRAPEGLMQVDAALRSSVSSNMNEISLHSFPLNVRASFNFGSDMQGEEVDMREVRHRFRMSELTSSISTKFSMDLETLEKELLEEDESNIEDESSEDDFLQEIHTIDESKESKCSSRRSSDISKISIMDALRSFTSSFSSLFSKGNSIRSSRMSNFSNITGTTDYSSSNDPTI